MVDSLITLFESTSTEFDTNGLGGLQDVISCVVEEERNGEFELEMQYPVTGKHYSDITLRKIIFTNPNPYDKPQPFRIYAITKPIDGIVTINAEHISYDLSGYPVSPFTSETVVTALQNMKSASVIPCPFSFTTDKSTTSTLSVTTPTNMRSILGGTEGSILDVYGGEYEFDKYLVTLHNNRGSNKGVSIRYGKNLTDLKQEENCSSVYTGVYPFWYSEQDGLIELTEKIVYADGTYDFTRICPLDLSQTWQDKPSEDEIKEETLRYMRQNNIGTPKISITVSFIPLSLAEEYKDYAILETIRLCDTVNIYFPEMNVSATAKCIKTSYDAISQRYIKIELGDATSNLATTISSQTQNTNKNPTKTFIEQAINNATKLITGGLGGHAILHSSTGDGYPDEYLMLDTDNILTAQNLWRWNMGGFGHSSTGYNGNFDTAITMDGHIVADFITLGTLRGSLLQADSVTSSAISQEFKSEITDEINQNGSVIRQEFIAGDGKVLSTINKTLSEYSKTTQMESSISQSSDTIMLEVNKKVNNSDFGTKITQNYSSIQLAWNNISKYIQFENAQLNIYDTNNTKLMSLSNSGQKFLYKNISVGQIGTNAYIGNSNIRGLVFDLEYSAGYMAWAWMESENADAYTMKFTYTTKKIDNYDANQLHAGCDLNIHGFNLHNAVLKNWAFSGGTISGTWSGNVVTSFHEDGRAATWKEFKLTFKNGILQNAEW